MKMLREINFSEVVAVFEQEHSVNEGTNNWARKRLENANNKFNGEWHLVQLSRKEVLNVLLVWHHDGELELIPERGMTVWEVARRWKEVENEYRKRNADCYQKVMKFSGDTFTPVFLSAGPIKGYNVFEYEKLVCRDNALVHLDGLHRLIAWAVAGRFNRFRYYLSGQKVNAFIAGPVE